MGLTVPTEVGAAGAGAAGDPWPGMSGGGELRALARAQRESLEAGAPAAAWAGLIILGDGDAVVAPEGGAHGPVFRWTGGWLGWGLAAALLLAAAVAGFFRYRRSTV